MHSYKSRYQSSEIRAPVCQEHVHPAASPTPHPRAKIVLLFHSTPSSSSVDQKFHEPRVAKPATSKSQRFEELRRDDRAPRRALYASWYLLPISKALRFQLASHKCGHSL